MMQDDLPGSSKKGKSLNHLLNFSFPEREQGGLSLPAPRRRTRAPVYNKERYIHASFRFLVAETEQYQGNLADPDLSVQWNNIEQVIVSTPQDQNCPVCLSAPIAPRITRCGHVFCSTCILHYLGLGEDKWRKCPICFEAVYEKDLKAVKVNKMVPYTEGNTLRMVLMQKAKQSYVAWPRTSWNNSVLTSVPPTGADPSAEGFSKLILATPPGLQQIYAADQCELEAQLNEARVSGDTDSIPFIEQGLVSVQERLKGLTSSPPSEPKPPAPPFSPATPASSLPEATRTPDPFRTPVQSPVHSRASSRTYLEELDEVFSDDEDYLGEHQEEHEMDPADGHSLSEESTEEDRSRQSFSDSDMSDLEQTFPNHLRLSAASSSPPRSTTLRVEEQLASSGYIYFYQAEDGQPIFAQQFMLKVLLADRGSLENLPDVIEAKILELEELSQTPEARKRFKNTAHLPLTSEFSFCELDLKRGSLISAETLREFQAEIQSREQKRITRARKDERDSRKTERHNLNDQQRYQRFLSSHAASLAAMEPLLQEEGFPQISPVNDAKASTPPRGNYAGILKGALEKPIFSDLDFAATLPSSSTSPQGRSDFPALGSSPGRPAPAPSPWGTAPTKPRSACELASSSSSSVSSAALPPPEELTIEEDQNQWIGPGSEGRAGGGGKKGGKGKKRTLLMTTGGVQRRY